MTSLFESKAAGRDARGSQWDTASGCTVYWEPRASLPAGSVPNYSARLQSAGRPQFGSVPMRKFARLWYMR